MRTAIVGACVVLATLTAGACASVNEPTNDLAMACGIDAEGVCVVLANDIVQDFQRRNPASGPIVKVTVSPRVCNPGLPAVRCWHVAATTALGSSSGAVYYQRPDGVLVDGRDNSRVPVDPRDP